MGELRIIRSSVLGGGGVAGGGSSVSDGGRL